MIIMRSGRPRISGPAVALGNFDGVHKAHQKLIKTAVDSGRPAIVHTLDPHPKSLIYNEPVPILTPPYIKRELIGALGAYILYIEKDTRALLSMQPLDFARDILSGRLGARLVVVGYDYRFGRGGGATADDLAAFGRRLGFDCIILDKVTIGGETVSSSALREALSSGDMQRFYSLSGRFHKMRGKVTAGKQIGREFGIPTANIKADKSLAIPKGGVYAATAKIGERRYPAVTNIGVNPTVGGENLSIETHILDYGENIYGEVLELEFIGRLRGEMRFPSVSELRAQILSDCAAARVILSPHLKKIN